MLCADWTGLQTAVARIQTSALFSTAPLSRVPLDGIAMAKVLKPVNGRKPDPKMSSKGGRRLSVERIYQKKTPREHVLLRPDTYGA